MKSLEDTKINPDGRRIRQDIGAWIRLLHGEALKTGSNLSQEITQRKWLYDDVEKLSVTDVQKALLQRAAIVDITLKAMYKVGNTKCGCHSWNGGRNKLLNAAKHALLR